MKSLIIKASFNSPSVNFNAKKNQLTIKGRSIPENVADFYNPLEHWLNDYLATNPEKITFEVNLDYLNTHSSGRLLLLMKRIAKHRVNHKNTEVLITWFHEEDDDDMRELGEQIDSILKLPFQVKKIST